MTATLEAEGHHRHPGNLQRLEHPRYQVHRDLIYFSINGTTVYTDTSINGSTAFSWVDMQAYNFFGDPSLADANPVDYTAYWSNTPVPIPGSLVLLASGLSGLGLLNWRKIFHS